MQKQKKNVSATKWQSVERPLEIRVGWTGARASHLGKDKVLKSDESQRFFEESRRDGKNQAFVASGHRQRETNHTEEGHGQAQQHEQVEERCLMEMMALQHLLNKAVHCRKYLGSSPSSTSAQFYCVGVYSLMYPHFASFAG